MNTHLLTALYRELIEPLVHGFSKSKHMSFKQLSSAIKFYCYKGKDSLNVEDDIYWYTLVQLNGMSFILT